MAIFVSEHVRIENRKVETDPENRLTWHDGSYLDVAICNAGYSNPERDNLRYNSIGTSVLRDYSQALDVLGKISLTQYAVIRWEGPNTGNGASIKEFQEMLKDPAFQGKWREFIERGEEIVFKARELPKHLYTISVLHGNVYGGSVELALPYNMVIAAEDTTIGFPEITLGIVPGFGGVALSYERTGRHNTEQLVSIGGSIDALTAMNIGLVDRVSKDPATAYGEIIEKNERPERGADSYQLKESDIKKPRTDPAPFVVGRVPSMMDEIESAYKLRGLEGALSVNTSACVELGIRDDFREGVTAFSEKRQPQYTGN